jgi:hypothetical protein
MGRSRGFTFCSTLLASRSARLGIGASEVSAIRSFLESKAFTALIGLTGVIIGIAGTFLVNSWEERRQEQRDFRSAIRLVDGELDRITVQLAALAQSGRVPDKLAKSRVPERFLPSKEWQANKAVLAENVSRKLWDELALVYNQTDAIWVRLFQGKPGEQFGRFDFQVFSSLCFDIAHIRTSWPEGERRQPTIPCFTVD